MTFCSKNVKTAVWELTLRCNAKCIHCGSAAGEDRLGNLTFEQAKDVVRQLNDLKCGHLTLIGGEYFLYPKWKELLEEFAKTKIKVGIVTNALALNPEKLDILKSFGIEVLGISIDGATAKTHDYIRRIPGCFDNAWKIAELSKEKDIPVTVITTINRLNITELKSFRDKLIASGIVSWQLQHSTLFGRMKEELALDDFGYYIVGIFCAQCFKIYAKKQLSLQVMHSMGYYSSVIPNHTPNRYWMGCMAGKYNLGIRSDGSVLGCLSLYDDKYIEGNVKGESIKEIRERKNFCYWNHRIAKYKNLSGFCKECVYGLACLGGCESYTPAQHKCYYEIESKWKNSVPVSEVDELLQKITQGHMAEDGTFYLSDNTELTDKFVNSISLDDYHKEILRQIVVR